MALDIEHIFGGQLFQWRFVKEVEEKILNRTTSSNLKNEL